ncbi:TetR/AcrR family transcriptional regulator [Dactylosporangium aurantiacum]|uniref:TetR/AcrR family transcriptional regulator n=1 Tax=Dactylosporangium aurantiacum TaxID=35754 RepID=A0A9Q9MI18_9ACTN|nr:TetR/AcrR family transcriptional regulator [Dactylosporangium aurantiacum]MDG6107826.1 helix-turn-helix domain containing protein [Dactylosporangium aurantiacum]UWZ57399.1 TetR/AcrR family transcriptional regulator [Dactylosporangium aurantiacum]
MNTPARPYRQRARAESASGNTGRILAAALELFVERPFEQVTLAAVAERAGVGLQTVIRRVGTKDGLVEAVNAWIAPQVAAGLGDPPGPDPALVAAAFRRHYSRWAPALERTLAQEDSSPALKASAEAGRAGHRGWLAAAFPGLDPVTFGRLVGVTGVELWLVLTKHEGLDVADAEATVALLIRSVISNQGQSS